MQGRAAANRRAHHAAPRQPSAPSNPVLDLALSLVLLVEGIAMVWLARNDAVVLGELAVCLVLNLGGFWGCKVLFRRVGRAIGTREALRKPRNLRKFADQSWSLVTHSAFSALEVYLAKENGWWERPKLCFADAGALDPLTRRVYVMQIATYLVAGWSHRFFEARHKDYFVMFAHHVATLFLLLGSFWSGVGPFGILVLLVHEVSDIPGDLAKMANYMGLDSKSGLYLTEAMFVGVLASWAYLRLFLFPTKLIASALFDTGNKCAGEVDGAFNGGFSPLCWAMRGLLVLLLGMHVFWYGLFLRLAAKLATGTDAHSAGREHYEGSSESEKDQ